MIKKQQYAALAGFVLTLILAINALIFGTQPGLGSVTLSFQLVLGIMAILTFPLTFLFWLLYTFKNNAVLKGLAITFALLALGSLIYIIYDQSV